MGQDLSAVPHDNSNTESKRGSCNYSKLSQRNNNGGSAKSSRSPSRDSSTLLLTPKDRLVLKESWEVINRDEKRVIQVIGTSWLEAAEKCPIWVWGLIGVEEGHRDRAFDNPAFVRLIEKIRHFLNKLVIDLDLEQDQCMRAAVMLGQRHRDYFAEGYQYGYWDKFATALHDAIIILVNDKRRQSKCSSGTGGKGSIPSSARSSINGSTTDLRARAISIFRGQHQVTDTWHRFLRQILLAMRAGYSGGIEDLPDVVDPSKGIREGIQCAIEIASNKVRHESLARTRSTGGDRNPRAVNHLCTAVYTLLEDDSHWHLSTNIKRRPSKFGERSPSVKHRDRSVPLRNSRHRALNRERSTNRQEPTKLITAAPDETLAKSEPLARKKYSH